MPVQREGVEELGGSLPRPLEGVAIGLAEELEAGTVTINDHLFSFGEPTATWGGIKKSGLGRSPGLYGLSLIPI